MIQKWKTTRFQSFSKLAEDICVLVSGTTLMEELHEMINGSDIEHLRIPVCVWEYLVWMEFGSRNMEG